MVKKEIIFSLITPTRGRPLEFLEFIESVLETADNPEAVEIIAYVDDDDSSYDRLTFPNTKVIRGARRKLSAYFTVDDCSGYIYSMTNDDVRFRTKGWDTIVLKEFDKFSDKIAVIYGEDGDPNPGKLNATFPFIHKNWVEVTGHLVPPIFSNNFIDTWVSEIADMLGRKIKIDIVTEHIHPDFGKRQKDQTDHDKWEKHWAENVPQIYIDSLPKRIEEAAALQMFIGGSR